MSSEGKGWIYIFSNPSMPGLLQIGQTDSNVESVLKKLDTTSVANPFKKEYEALIEESKQVEKKVHSELEKYRVRKNRRFFKCSPQTAATSVIEATQELDLKILHDELFFTPSHEDPDAGWDEIHKIKERNLYERLTSYLKEKDWKAITGFLECNTQEKKWICSALNNPKCYMTSEESGMKRTIIFDIEGKPYNGWDFKIMYEKIVGPSRFDLRVELREIVDGIKDEEEWFRSISWYPNGRKESQFIIGYGKRDENDCWQKGWYPNGELSYEQKDGITQTWYSNGKNRSIEYDLEERDTFWTIDGFEVSREEAENCGIIEPPLH